MKEKILKNISFGPKLISITYIKCARRMTGEQMNACLSFAIGVLPRIPSFFLLTLERSVGIQRMMEATKT